MQLSAQLLQFGEERMRLFLQLLPNPGRDHIHRLKELDTPFVDGSGVTWEEVQTCRNADDRWRHGGQRVLPLEWFQARFGSPLALTLDLRGKVATPLRNRHLVE